jgi:triacylglycerol lipase
VTIPKLRTPIVLVHGLLGFDRLQVNGWTVANYFGVIPDALAKAGNRVCTARLSPTGGVAQRAAELKTFMDKVSPAEPVHLIAHSMGGLDSRYMISQLQMGHRVLSLTTLGTPHRGTPFADWGVSRFERFLSPILDRLGIPAQAFRDLTTDKCRQFNEQVNDVSSVRYFSVAGRHEAGWHSPAWQLSHPIVTQAEGPNDGLVSVASATYGESCEVWDGDHFSLINWGNPFAGRNASVKDRSAQYAKIIGRLSDEGF